MLKNDCGAIGGKSLRVTADSFFFMLKQVILVRKDLNMPCGKLAAQVAHAAVDAAHNATFNTLWLWKKSGKTKIVLGVAGYEDLAALFAKAKDANLPCSFIVDEGRTVFNGEYTSTTCGIGPADADVIDTITGHLELY